MTYSLLSLGDSYTIGEGVSLPESFPYQVVISLRKEGFHFQAPEIIAKTGWTTDELQKAITRHHFQPRYDFTTLLIGVNNQYRGLSPESYKTEFESLLKQAIHFTGKGSKHTIVLSIPDWGVTPFAAIPLPDGKSRNPKKIALEIDNFNRINRELAEKYGVNYLDITPGTREAATDNSLLSTDGLHPSAKEYSKWAEKIISVIRNRIKNDF